MAQGEFGLLELGPDLRKVIDSPKRYSETVRGRAVESYAETVRTDFTGTEK